MKSLRYEDVSPDAALFLALVRGRISAPHISPPTPSGLATAVRVAQGRSLPRGALVDALIAGMEAIVPMGAVPEAARAEAQRLRADGVVVVVTGQQPGLFGGPSLVFAKALSALALARRLELQGTAAVAVFWSASEDHDHAEAESVALIARGLSGGDELRRFALRLPRDGRMLARTAVPANGAAVAAEFAAALPDGPGHADIAALVVPRDDESVAAWSTRVVLELLGPLGLVVVEPSTLRPFAPSVIAHELRHPGVLAAAVAAGEAAIATSHGFARPLALPHSELYFTVDATGRRRHANAGDGAPHLDPSLAVTDPSRFSWNVASRVLAQNSALPVAAQICGPSELGYCSALGEAHAILQIPAPAFLPRAGLTIVDPRVRAACEALAVSPEDVVRTPSVLGAFAVPEPPAALAEIARLTTLLPPGSGPAARRRLAATLRNLDLYASALAREDSERAAASDGRRTRILSALRPFGALQERHVSILSFVARHGVLFLPRILDALVRAEPEHLVFDAVED